MMLSNVLYLYFNDPALLTERSTGHLQQNKNLGQVAAEVCYLFHCWFFICRSTRAASTGPLSRSGLRSLGGLMLLPALYPHLQRHQRKHLQVHAVRIQDERGQKVIFNRYLWASCAIRFIWACFLMMLGSPLLLGSIWGLLISLGWLRHGACAHFGREKNAGK